LFGEDAEPTVVGGALPFFVSFVVKSLPFAVLCVLRGLGGQAVVVHGFGRGGRRRYNRVSGHLKHHRSGL
jgi:hypothetical protein